MPSRTSDREVALPVIPEHAEPTSSRAMYEDEAAAAEREEQGMFDRDNFAGEAGAPDAADGDDAAAPFGDGGDPGPIYVQSSAGDRWELTWPIWHMLPREERRAIARQHGMRSIGEFEEHMTLTRAVDESEGMGGAGRGGTVIAPEAAAPTPPGAAAASKGDWHPPFIGSAMAENEDDESSVSSEEEIDSPSSAVGEASNGADDLNLEHHLEAIRLGGLPCTLPDEVLHRCFAHLPVADHAALALVSPHWSRFARSEALYEALCRRVYLNQSQRKALHVARFGGSYRAMLARRPRVRAGGGVYVLEYRKVKKIERDLWHGADIPLGAVLETVYFRYLYFFEDGRALYALTHVPPAEMVPRLAGMLVRGAGSKDRWGVWGRYQIRRDVVQVRASQAWHEVCFQLRVLPSNKVLHYDAGDWGTYTTMALEKHMSSESGNFEEDSRDLVQYDIPLQCYFRFLRDRRL